MKQCIRDHERDELVVRWYEQDSMTYKMIGSRLRISLARVGQLYHRILVERRRHAEKENGRNGS